ncbi:tRNA CCA-pyrophosphorylase [Halobacteriales archaeon QS_9_68_17]|nr:MAG: tRNA CCA-pyrophosphorylase [Halobacteriales archaeon QS_9_68_17]
MTDDAFDAAVRAVREEIDPAPGERERLAAAAEDLIERAEDAVADLDVAADALLVGSTARGTWIGGDRDIDVFVRFPADLDRETLEKYGLRVGDEVLPEGHEEYAEHPYVTGTRGFSGYLTELLVLRYGGFREFVEAAADWHPPVRLDPEDHGEATFDDPLVVVDPTDPERNVAAVLSPDNVARVQHYARELLADPRSDLFFPDPPEPIAADAVREHLADRGTSPVAVRFDAPDVVEDQLYPQLRKSLSGVTEELDRRGFDVLRAAAFAGDDAVLFVELAVAELPAVERHDGPPVHVRQHATGFFEKYADGDDYGPFVDGDRYVVERDRAHPSAADFVASDALFDVGLGATVEEALRDGYEVLVGDEVAALASAFGAALARYFSPRP